MENSPESSNHRPVDAAKLEDRKGTGSTGHGEGILPGPGLGRANATPA